MIAQYDEVKDDFLAHRVSQAYEMSQFIKTTSGGSDVIIAGGDFNLQPKDLGYKMIVANTGMHDSWLSQVGRQTVSLVLRIGKNIVSLVVRVWWNKFPLAPGRFQFDFR